MVRRMLTEEEWDSLDFLGDYITIREGQQVLVQFESGIWTISEGEPDLNDRTAKFDIMQAVVTLLPSGERKILNCQKLLTITLKRVLKENKIPIKALENKKPIFLIRRNDLYGWYIEFRGFNTEEKSKTEYGTNNEFKNEFKTESSINSGNETKIKNEIVNILEEEGEILLSTLVPVLKEKTKINNEDYIRSVITKLINEGSIIKYNETKKVVELKNTNQDRQKTEMEQEIEEQIQKIIKSDGGRSNKEDIISLVSSVLNKDRKYIESVLNNMNNIYEENGILVVNYPSLTEGA